MNASPNSRFSMLRRACADALQWRLMLLWVLAVAFTAMVFALPIWSALAEQLDHSVHARAWATSINVAMLADLTGALGKQHDALAGAGMLSIAMMLALTPFLDGMLVASARAAKVLDFGELVHGGMREYWRMFRMAVWCGVILALAMGVSYGATHAVNTYAEKAILEADVEHARWSARAFTAVIVLFALTTVHAGRAALAFDANRRSAVKAWWRGFKLVLRNPVATWGCYVLITLLAAVVVALLIFLRTKLPMGNAAGACTGILVAALISAVAPWVQGARLLLLLEVTRARHRARFPLNV